MLISSLLNERTESIQFSVLGGRILFKNLRYHSSNQTIIILKGQLSWRYWIRAPAQEADLSSVGGLDGDLSCAYLPPLVIPHPYTIHFSPQRSPDSLLVEYT